MNCNDSIGAKLVDDIKDSSRFGFAGGFSPGGVFPVFCDLFPVSGREISVEIDTTGIGPGTSNMSVWIAISHDVHGMIAKRVRIAS